MANDENKKKRTARLNNSEKHRASREEKPVGPVRFSDPKSVAHRITSSQESLATKYASNENLARVIHIREATENGAANNAKTFWVYTQRIRGSLCVVIAHDGDVFADDATLAAALQPNTSTGGKGANGCGGMLTGTLLVGRQDRYHHMIISKHGGGATMMESRLDDGLPIVNRVEDSLLEEVRTSMGSLWAKCNVVYITRFETKSVASECFINDQCKALIKDFCTSLIDDERSLVLHDSLVLEEGQVYDEHTTVHMSGHPYKLPSDIDFDEAFYRCRYTIPANNCRIVEDEDAVMVNAEVELTLYDGLVRKDTRSTASRLIRVNGNGVGQALYSYVRPDLNTFVSFDYQKSERFSRLNRQPVFAGKMLDKFGMAFGMNICDRREASDDFRKFPELQSIIAKIKKKNPDTQFSRVPFARLKIRIKEVVSVNGKSVAELNEAGLRRHLGGVDEMFCVADRYHLMRYAADIFQVAAEDPDNQEGIADIRGEVEKMWPNNSESLAELPIFSKFKENYLTFVDTKNRRSIPKIGPGEYAEGYLIFSDTQDPVPTTWEFEAFGDGDNRLVRISNDGRWGLRISDYQIKDENGDYIGVDEKTWIEKGESRNRLPSAKIRFKHDEEIYTLATRVKLPAKPVETSDDNTGKGASPGSSGTKDKDGRRGRSMFHGQDPPERRISMSNGHVKLNTKNNDICLLFADVKKSKAAREKLWERIQREASDAIKCVQTRIGVIPNRSEHGLKILKLWNEDLDGYMINQIVAPVFRSKEAGELLEANSRALGKASQSTEL